jgi:cell wall-associated NlpC family hydrolase
MDCSGFTKLVYRLNGKELNRDADQQSLQGVTINPGKDFQNLKIGDLLFFRHSTLQHQSKKITHVGLYIGRKEFIHSSGSVHVSSFDPASPYFDTLLLQRFAKAQRIIAPLH